VSSRTFLFLASWPERSPQDGGGRHDRPHAPATRAPEAGHHGWRHAERLRDDGHAEPDDQPGRMP
jgi:hypothetical protein